MGEPIGSAGREARRLAGIAISAGAVHDQKISTRTLSPLSVPDVQRQAVSQPTSEQAAMPGQGATNDGAAGRPPALEAVAERVYRLLLEDLRRARERHGC